MRSGPRPLRGLTENRQDHRSEAVEAEAGDRLAGNCNDGEEAATARDWLSFPKIPSGLGVASSGRIIA